jgi:predicted ATPase/DNA-binding CsgD family transcriptional regulator
MADLRGAPPHNLPVSLTSFVGREREVAEVVRLLRRARLVTLTGEGGCGKSRLALETARAVQKWLAGGAWVVELAALSDPGFVPRAVATALGVAERPRLALTATLARALRPKTMLLVLDNCEHLRIACAHLADALLREAPGLRMLTTSRESLDVPGEATWRVPPLSRPDLAHLPSPDRLLDYEAVRLFADRARSIRPEFRITAANARAVAEICDRLDGMPLAIELAAARSRTLTVEQIAARLHDRFRLLTRGGPTILPRHQTLRAAMDWGYELLSERERAVLRRLSVFAGGWTLEAAERVCAGGDVEAADLLDGLASLAAKSLIGVETQGAEARYRMLETVRQYAGDRLREAGETAAVRRRHRDWCLALAALAEPHLWGPEQHLWLARLEREHDNLRAALEPLQPLKPLAPLESDGGGSGGARDDSVTPELRLAAVLGRLWVVHGHWSEGRSRLDGVLSRHRDAVDPAMPRVLEVAAFLAERQGDDERALALAERTLAVSRRLGDGYGIADALVRMASLALHRGRYAEARALCRQCLALDAPRDITLALAILGNVERSEGRLADAEAAFGECLEISRTHGDRSRAAYAMRGLAAVALQRRRAEDAQARYAEGLRASRDVDFKMVTAACLEGLGHVAVAQGRHDAAARWMGAADALRESLGLRPMPVDAAAHEHAVAAARRALGDRTFAAASARGRAMSMDAVIDDALAGAGAAPDPAARARDRRRPPDQILTRREQEVASLIVRGLTNRDIAARLAIGERTAESHVQNILNKLGFTARAQIAAWAVTHDLDAAGAAPR